MKNSWLLIPIVAIVLACGTKKNESDTSGMIMADSLTDNKLTAQQQADGWKVLFDGETMTGWRPFKNQDNDNWEVLDGTLHCKKVNDSIPTKRADLMTVEQYQNFEFSFDWRIAPKGNSGIIYRVTEEFDVPYASGPEYQLIDDANYPGELKEVNKTAANYDMEAAAKDKVLKPANEWNSSKLVMNGNHVEHWLNGKKVLEYELGSNEWKKKVAGSKWKDYPGYGLAHAGYIDLQDHGSEAWFRNLFIKVL